MESSINQISCGQDYSLFLCESGYVFGCGCNRYGQLGQKNSINIVEKIKITLMAVYYNRPWKKVKLYTQKNNT